MSTYMKKAVLFSFGAKKKTKDLARVLICIGENNIFLDKMLELRTFMLILRGYLKIGDTWLTIPAILR